MAYRKLVSRPGVTRAVCVCESRYLVCPKCGDRIPRVTPHRGTSFASCGGRGFFVEGRPNPRCNQHVMVLAMPQGVSIVVGITVDEKRIYSEDARPARDIFLALGGVFPAIAVRTVHEDGLS